MNTKYVFVSGGVASSLGKGIISASLAKLLQARGLRVTIQKFDPYINIDPGTLNPYEHGECYVTEDGAETDLDLGHYERFLGVHTSKANNVTTGKIYNTVISKEREGAYLGKTVQIVPHITDEIKRRMLLLGKSGKYDIVITEIGGTVGDMESQPFVEAVRQLQWELPEEDCLTIHLTLVPYLSAAKELRQNRPSTLFSNFRGGVCSRISSYAAQNTNSLLNFAERWLFSAMLNQGTSYSQWMLRPSTRCR